MDVCNAALEQLGFNVKEEEIITASAKAADDEAAIRDAKCDVQKPKFPSRTLCYHVSIALQALAAVKMQQQENHEQLELEECVSTAASAVMKSRNSKERAKEVANINKQLDAGLGQCWATGHAVLRLFLQRPCRIETLAHERTMKCTSVQYRKQIYTTK